LETGFSHERPDNDNRQEAETGNPGLPRSQKIK
jgi:hypothetical protein